MTYEYKILLGKISRINGYDGSVTIKLEKSFLDNIPEMESVFIEINGKPVPFFISSTDYSGGNLLKLKFDRYEAYEKVSEFIGCKIYLTSLDEEIQPADKPENILGFRVLLKNKILIGTINEIIKNPGHDLMRVISERGKEILIPFHEDFILDFDPEGKSIIVELPDGLEDVN
jgi:16S rRNA processing protein RimM